MLRPQRLRCRGRLRRSPNRYSRQIIDAIGDARPSSLITKSWTRTSSGWPCGRFSPPFLQIADQFLLLVSTEITGCCPANAAATCVLMYRTAHHDPGVCAFLRLAVALQAITHFIQQFAHQGAAMVPLLVAAPAPVDARSCRSTAAVIPDRPRVVGSTSASDPQPGRVLDYRRLVGPLRQPAPRLFLRQFPQPRPCFTAPCGLPSPPHAT